MARATTIRDNIESNEIEVLTELWSNSFVNSSTANPNEQKIFLNHSLSVANRMLHHNPRANGTKRNVLIGFINKLNQQLAAIEMSGLNASQVSAIAGRVAKKSQGGFSVSKSATPRARGMAPAKKKGPPKSAAKKSAAKKAR
jgi:thiamine kinase-like enzyme